MALALDEFWPKDAPLSGAVVTRYGHIPPELVGNVGRIAIYEAAHPVPDHASVFAARTMLNLVCNLTADDLVICLLSGGASALLALPIEGVSLSEKQAITRQLLMSGAPIDEMNVVRQSLSQIKGGQLADACGDASLLTLAISDVPGDKAEVIGSGPSIQMTTSDDVALEILDRRHIEIPHAVRQAIVQHGHLRRVRKPRISTNDKVQLIATPAQSLMAAAEHARALGIVAYVLSDSIEGESRDVAKFHADIARAVREGKSSMQRPCVILSGGETTVTVSCPQPSVGRGGRAGEFCLGLAKALGGSADIWALAADTDGIDGCEINAGAFVSPETLNRAQALGLSIDDFLLRHDSYSFFDAMGDLFITGPTYTNVNDFRAILIT
jgi:hydroxypyruvate reductase